MATQRFGRTLWLLLVTLSLAACDAARPTAPEPLAPSPGIPAVSQAALARELRWLLTELQGVSADAQRDTLLLRRHGVTVAHLEELESHVELRSAQLEVAGLANAEIRRLLADLRAGLRALHGAALRSTAGAHPRAIAWTLPALDERAPDPSRDPER